MVDGPIFDDGAVGGTVQACRQAKGAKAKGWDLPMTMDDTPSRRSERKPEDLQHGLTKFYNQYETKDA